MELLFLCAFGIYGLTLIGISLIFYRVAASARAFTSGNHSINYWVTAIAAQSSDMGSWLFLGLPAAVFVSGLFECWSAIGLTFFMFLSWHFVAPRLRELSARHKCTTLPDYFASVCKQESQAVRLTSSLITLVFFTFYITSALVGLGRLFEAAFEIPYHTGIIMGLVVGVLYPLLGGFIAVAWCDLFQGIFLLFMLILVPSYAFTQTGGVSAIIEAAHAQNVSLSLLGSGQSLVSGILLAASWGLGYFGQPHILTYFMAIDDARKIRYAKYIGISWQILALSAATAVGLVSLAFFHGTALPNSELIFVILAKTLFHPLLAGFALCAIMAATLSSMDTQILLSGSIIAQDIYARLYDKKLSEQYIVWLSRVGSIAISLLALAFAWGNSNSVYDLVNYAWSGLGAAFGPTLLVTLYTTRYTKRGIVAGMIAGATVSALWPYLGTPVLPLVPGFCANLCAIYCIR